MDDLEINPRNVTLVIDEFATHIEKLRRFKKLTDTEIMAGFICGVVSMSEIKNMTKSDMIEFVERIYDMCKDGEKLDG
jgi:hypothetical protein